MIKEKSVFGTGKLTQVCRSVCRNAPLRSGDRAGLLGNYLTENQITYCLHVSYLRVCQTALRQLGITNNPRLMQPPAFFMSCMLRGGQTGSRKWTSFHCSKPLGIHPHPGWGNIRTVVFSDGLVLWDSSWVFNQEQRIWRLSLRQSPLLGKFESAIDMMTSENLIF